MKTNPLRLPSLLLGLTCVLLSCGGGGGKTSTGNQATGATTLWIDSTAGSETMLDGQLVAASLEAANGALTGNLLESNAVHVPFAAPSGTPFVLSLRDVPEGEFVALHLMFAPGTVRALRGGLEVPVELERPDHRVVFEAPFHRTRGGEDWFHMSHRGGLQLVPSGPRERWIPDFSLRRGDDSSFGGLELVVLGFDANDFTVQAIPTPRHGPVTFTLHVPLDAVLTLHDQYRLLARSEFFGLLRNGAKLRVRGTIAADRTVTVRSGELRLGGQGSGENKVYARVESLPMGTVIQVQLLAVVRGAGPGGSLPVRPVDAGRARIYRSGSSHLSLPLSAIEVGQWLEIEWSGPFSTDPILAREIEIESDSSSRPHPEIEGQVGRVDLPNNELVMVQRGDDPLLVGGQRRQELRVRIHAGSNLFRQDSGNKTRISLSQVVVGERVWARGTMDLQGVLEGSWVRVRSR